MTRVVFCKVRTAYIWNLFLQIGYSTKCYYCGLWNLKLVGVAYIVGLSLQCGVVQNLGEQCSSHTSEWMDEHGCTDRQTDEHGD